MAKEHIVKCLCNGLKEFYGAPMTCNCNCKGCKQARGCVKDAIKGFYCSECR